MKSLKTVNKHKADMVLTSDCRVLVKVSMHKKNYTAEMTAQGLHNGRTEI